MFSEMTTLLILVEVGHVYMSRTYLPVKNMRTLDEPDDEPSKGIEDVWVSIQASKFKSIIVVAAQTPKHKPRVHCISGKNVTNL